MADDLFDKKVEITRLNKRLSDLKGEAKQYEEKLLSNLKVIGLDQVRTEKATFSISTSTQPVAKDWDKIHKWIMDNDALHLLQRRISTGPYGEYLEQGIQIDGVESYEHSVIKTRKR